MAFTISHCSTLILLVVTIPAFGQLLSDSLLQPLCDQDPEDFWNTINKKTYDLYWPYNKMETPPLRCKNLTPLEKALQGWGYTLHPNNFPSLPPNISVDDYRVILKLWQKMESAFQQLYAMDLDRPATMRDLISWTVTSFILLLLLPFVLPWAKSKIMTMVSR